MNETYYPYRVSAKVKSLYASYDGVLTVHARDDIEAEERARQELAREYKTNQIVIKLNERIRQ